MITITYTYDESDPTNKDYLIATLTGNIDDGGASYEAVAIYNINCPYIWDKDCLNHVKKTEYDSEEFKDNCVKCKMAWLDRKYDTYPSDDGIFEEGEDAIR